MHVVIVGAGEVGWYLAQRLGAEGHDVAVVEVDEVTARSIGEPTSAARTDWAFTCCRI